MLTHGLRSGIRIELSPNTPAAFPELTLAHKQALG